MTVKKGGLAIAYYNSNGEHIKADACSAIPINLTENDHITIDFSNLGTSNVYQNNNGFRKITVYKIDK